MSEPLIDTKRGLVSRAVYSDEAIYRQEMERIFARTWLFLGQEALIPRPGDYLTTYMGEESVILWRDSSGLPHAFLNTCRHRGNRVCLFERGRAASMTCSYHGWTYDSEGRLAGVPLHEEAYYGELDRDEWGLVEAPKLQVYGGLIFGCWDPAAPPLDEYLGDMRWYLDRILLVGEDLGGFDELAASRYEAGGNWKIPAENFAGDHYHNPTTHGSTYALGLRAAEPTGPQDPSGPFEVAIEPGHGLGGLQTGQTPFERDLARAQQLGPEVVEYVKERCERLHERAKDSSSKPYGFSHANIFPNCALWGGGAFRGNGIFVFHPRGPARTEIRQTVLIPRHAPRAVREIAYNELGRTGHFASGMFEQDDAHNFERVTESTRGFIARRYPFYFGMGLKQERRWPGQEEWDVHGFPGVIGPRFSEHVQRLFYAYWAQLMAT